MIQRPPARSRSKERPALAAWMLDHDALSYEDVSHAFDGHPVGDLTRDEVLDNITLTWFTNTGVSSGRLYWENQLGFFDVKNVSIPAAVSVFPKELYQAPPQLGREGVPEPHLLQRGRQRQPLRGLAGAATLFRRGSRGLQTTAQIKQAGERHGVVRRVVITRRTHGRRRRGSCGTKS
jgi:hypothetical protein